MHKKNEGLTPEEIVVARIEHNKECLVKNKVHLLEVIDRLIEYLQVNRESIGGISVNIVAEMGCALYDPEDNDASEGMSAQVGLRSSLVASMDKHLKRIIDGVNEDEESQGFDLRSLLAGLGQES